MSQCCGFTQCDEKCASKAEETQIARSDSKCGDDELLELKVSACNNYRRSSAHLARFGQIPRGYRKGENVRQLLLRSKT
jgi:hypothetical protein